jgi:hypothetical protein
MVIGVGEMGIAVKVSPGVQVAGIGVFAGGGEEGVGELHPPTDRISNSNQVKKA